MSFLSKHKKLLIFLLIIFFILLLSGGKDKNSNNPSKNNTGTEINNTKPVASSNPKPRGNRVIGMDINVSKVSFNDSFPVAKKSGVGAVEIPIYWDDSEPKPGQFENGWLPTANKFYPSQGIKISISLNPVDTNNSRMPKDLKDKPLNDPEVIKRYKAFIDFESSLVPNSDVLFVSLGNEIDIYLGDSDKKWQEYTDFFASVAPYAKEKFPKAMIGAKMSFNGTVNLNDKVQQINKYTDVVLVTYYPFKSNSFIVEDPSVVHSDFKKVVDLYPNKKIYFAEIGYPSGSLNGSSEEKQAEFVKEAFSAWDTYKDKIYLLSFVWMNDKTPEEVSGYQKYYGISDKTFASYMSSLGLRTYDGKSKLAFTMLQEESKNRGW